MKLEHLFQMPSSESVMCVIGSNGDLRQKVDCILDCVLLFLDLVPVGVCNRCGFPAIVQCNLCVCLFVF